MILHLEHESDDLALGTRRVWWSCTWNTSLMILHLEHDESDDLALGTRVWWSCTWNTSLMILHLEHESDDLRLGTWVFRVESLCCDSLQSLESSTLQSSYLWPTLQSLQLRCKHLDSCHSWSWRALIINLWQLQFLAPSSGTCTQVRVVICLWPIFSNAPGLAGDFQQCCKHLQRLCTTFLFGHCKELCKSSHSDSHSRLVIDLDGSCKRFPSWEKFAKAPQLSSENRVIHKERQKQHQNPELHDTREGWNLENHQFWW